MPVRRAEPSSTVSFAFEVERRSFDLLNTKRATQGLPPLVWDERVAEIARMHSQNMAEQDFFSHRGKDGGLVDDRAAVLGLHDWRAIGENIAFLKGYADPADSAVEKWMESASHRNNVLSPRWKESAVGVAVTADGKHYFTQVFVLRG